MFAAHGVSATTFCISNGSNGPSQFDTAMQYWTNAVNETVYVHLEQGTYTILNHGGGYINIGTGTGYEQDGGNYGGSGNATLHLVGGFVPNTNCASRVVDATKTTIRGDASSNVRIFELMQQDGALLIDGLTFKLEAGVLIRPSHTSATVRNVIVAGVTSNGAGNVYGAALTFAPYPGASSGNSFRAENLLVSRNSFTGIYVVSDNSNDSATLVNVTVADNGGYGIGVGVPGDSNSGFAGTFRAYNVIARGNASDIAVDAASATPSIYNSDFHSHTGTLGGSGNIDVNPQFVDALNNNYDLGLGSPVINKGLAAASVPGGYASTDIRGRTRVIGSRIDLGAYESTVNDNASQVVTTAVDDTLNTTPGTLRAAITAANANPNATTITFNIAGGCPQTLQVLAALPDITSDITIDGYTQPGATPNTTAPGYNGTICLVLDGFTKYGLRVSGAGRLTVRGLDFERFGAAAVHLSAGTGNEVTGNTFQNDPNYTQLGQVGVLIDGSASASQIGNYAFGDRNAFNRLADAAVKIVGSGGQHNITGNYFGFTPDGGAYNANSGKNGFGVYVSNSANNSITVNYIGGSVDSAIYLAGSSTTANTISSNGIGLGPIAGNYGNGQGGCGSILCLVNLPSIDLVAGAHDNVIGESGCVAGIIGANTITGNYGPGVALESSAGTGNSVCGNNLIYANNGNLAIDLGDDGTTSNDSGDADTGPNNLANYPILYQALRVAPNTMRVSGALQNVFGVAQGYHIDVYWSDSCQAGDAQGQRGELKRYVGFLNLFSANNVYAVLFPNTDLVTSTSAPKSGYLSAIATDPNGNTSEPGTCVAIFDDLIFADTFDH